MTKLFKKDKINKFFDILSRLERAQCDWYKGIDKHNKKDAFCQREIFINRTIGKWLRGKHLIIYGDTLKHFYSLIRIEFAFTQSDAINVIMIDYSKGCKLNHLRIYKEDALKIEGEWCDNSLQHVQLADLLSLDSVPNKEYVFRAYDWTKLPKRVKKGVNPVDVIKTTKSFMGKTEAEAYEIKNRFSNMDREDKTTFTLGELIETKKI